jgi:hypothetical protein
MLKQLVVWKIEDPALAVCRSHPLRSGVRAIGGPLVTGRVAADCEC